MNLNSKSDASIQAICSSDLDPLFWRPSRLGTSSTWWGHVPFAYWLVRETQPKVIVELGTRSGVSITAFCDAVVRAKLDTRCYGILDPEADKPADSAKRDTYRQLKKFHDLRFASFSKLICSPSNECMTDLVSGSVDILHIEAPRNYEDACRDFDLWRPKLSEKATVLFHGTNIPEAGPGALRFWEKLKTEFPSFEFLHGRGLGVLAVGRAPPGSIAMLCGLNDEGMVGLIRERFGIVGERWMAHIDREALETEMCRRQVAEKQADSLTIRLREVEKLAEAEIALREQIQNMAHVNIRDLKGELLETRERVDTLQRSQGELERRESMILGSEANRRTNAMRLSELERMNEVLVSTLAELSDERDEALRARDALLASTSWRLTAPIRKMRTVLRRRR